ncbi:nitroreductase [Granulosicoccaceae sp. 1_MG-2023]|nr:nitroreductase [Granulosicoccaceae sp. 1_MG-2023]
MPHSLPEISLVDAITGRRSVRGFLPREVPPDVLQKVFELAQLAPSNCNTQPWQVYVASGALKERLREQFVTRLNNRVAETPDYPYVARWQGLYRQRQVDCAVALYNEMGIARDDKEGRFRAIRRNFEFFDAPHIAFIGMNREFGASISVDVGIYAQTLMLALHAYGIGSCAMGSMRAYPDLVREAFDLDESTGILLAITFGYEDPQIDANRTRTERAALHEAVVFKS